MAFQVDKPPLSGVPCLSTTVLLLISLLLSCSRPKSCTCSGSDLDQFGNIILNYRSTFDQLPGYLFLTGSSACPPCSGMVCSGLGYYRAYYSYLDLSQTGWFSTLYSIGLSDGMVLYEASFSIVFTMSIYQPNNQAKANSSLIFAIQPALHPDKQNETYVSLKAEQDEMDLFLKDIPQGDHFTILCNTRYGNVAGSLVSSQIRAFQRNETTILVRVGIEQPGNSSVANKYSVWIDYDDVEQRMSVYVGAGEGTPKPANDMISAILNRPDIVMPPQISFGFFSSMGQLLQLHTWNSTIRRLQFCSQFTHPEWFHPHLPSQFQDSQSQFRDSQSQGNLTIILSSILGSAAATAITAAVVYIYFTSKYRKWKKEQDKLAKTMQRLPGVPAQVDYADIKKATKNFHGTMKLGKGGFGAVYRCTLPAAATSRTGRAVDVAVKKFMREVEDRRYDDFLAEVSIINRLRHKSIVPLFGWSYNKGEPVLIYEYMSNGSLDQHLFKRSGNGPRQQQQQEDTSIWQWQTRYNIAKDIATGLHYVHHEHEPMVLHRDIKASNIMLDSTFRARLGDFGIASTVAIDRSSVTGIAGTWGYIAPEYAMTYRSTRQTDAYAFGVLILEVVTGKKNGDVPPDDDHITDWVWRLHQQGKLLEAVDGSVLTVGDDQQDDFAEEAERLLLLGLACTNPNPSKRPSMGEAVQVITKLAPPPDVPLERPAFMWPPEDWRSRNSVYSTAVSNFDGSSASSVELVQVIQEQPLSGSTGEHASVESTARPGAIRGV